MGNLRLISSTLLTILNSCIHSNRQKTDKLMIWTHYFNEEDPSRNKMSFKKMKNIMKIRNSQSFIGVYIFCLFFLFMDAHANLALISLDAYLQRNRLNIIEGHTSVKQREAFSRRLNEIPNIKKIAEVGFNAGHSAELFLENAKEASLVSFDINAYDYTRCAVKFLKKKYRNRFLFIEGDSLNTIPRYYQTYPDSKFDVIFIDGCHLYDCCLADIINFKNLAHENTILWIDDYHPLYCPPVTQAVDDAEKLGIIKILGFYSVEDQSGLRCWVEAKFAFSEPG